MSSTGEKASEGLLGVSASEHSSSKGMDDESMQQTQQSIQKSEAQRLQEQQGESAMDVDPPRTAAHDTKPSSSGEALLSGHHAGLTSNIPMEDETPRQVIAVSASKGPAAFFNLARKFLVTDEMCDLSALEGAIVSAVDAAHLLERSQHELVHVELDRVSPLAVPVMTMIGREAVPQGAIDEELLLEAETLAGEAMWIDI